MATNFWQSSHHNRWLFDPATIAQARVDDLKYADNRELALIAIFFANLIAKLGKRLTLRQQVIATATVFFRRFYMKSSYCDTDPFLVASACCYVAAKTEETPMHLKTVVQESRSVYTPYGIKTFPTDNSKLAEMEFYLLEDLEFNLVVFHPYRSLAALCGRLVTVDPTEAGEVGSDPDEERFWGTGEGQLKVEDGCVQMAWFVINDSYRGDLCLQYPPYLVAIASLYLAVLLHGNTRAKLNEKYDDATSGTARYATRSTTVPAAASLNHIPPRDEILDFLAGINVSLEVISRIIQQIISIYALWDTFSDGTDTDLARRDSRQLAGLASGLAPRGDTRRVVYEKDIVALLLRMREQKESDNAHPPAGRPIATKALQRIE